MDNQNLLVIWSSADREVAFKTAFMYTYHAQVNGWWDHIQFCIWGPSAKLVVRDYGVRAELAKLNELGVELTACKACTDMYGVSEALEKLNVNVIYMGEPLTDMLKSGWKVLTY